MVDYPFKVMGQKHQKQL